jgi:hypothetical protein
MERGIERLSPESPFYDALKNERRSALLGAILPDAPYYLALGKSSLGNAVAEVLHGRQGEDTFRLPTLWATRILTLPSAAQSASWALWAGYLSHCVTDQIFHPLVYWFTGNYYASDKGQRTTAREYHRAFESSLDSLMTRPTLPRRISELLVKADWDDLGSLTLLGEVTNDYPGPLVGLEQSGQSFWKDALRSFSSIQSLTLNRPLAMGLKLGAHAFRGLKQVEALCVPLRVRPAEERSLSLEFKNPISAEITQSTIEELLERSVTRLLSELARAAAWRDSTDPQDQPLSPRGGTSLAFDLWQVRESEATEFLSPTRAWLLEL